MFSAEKVKWGDTQECRSFCAQFWISDSVHFPWLNSPSDLWEKVGKDTLHCLRSSIYIAKIPNPVHFWERTKSWATLLWQALLKGSGPHLPWHRQKTQLLPWSRQGSLCYPAASLQMVWDLQMCFHHWGLETGIEIQYGNTHFFFFFSYFKRKAEKPSCTASFWKTL